MRLGVRTGALAAVLCAAFILAVAASASASLQRRSPVHSDPGSGLHVDPASPVAKEYALPLDTARGTSAEGRQVLFGAGIRHRAGTPTEASAAPAAYRELRPGSGSSLLWMVIAAVVVITLGGLGGVALRRRR